MDAQFTDLGSYLQAWLATEGMALARNLLACGFVLVLGSFGARIVGNVLSTAMSRTRLQPTPLFRQFVINTARKVVWIVAIIVALGNLGVDTGALVAGLGASGLVIGFALKDTLSNFAAGALILLYRPFDVGHFVEISNTSGKVHDMTLVSTVLATSDNKLVTIPNSAVWNNVIINYSACETRRIDLIVGVAYDTDLDVAEGILYGVLMAHPKVLREPELVVRVAALADSAVNFHVRGWVLTEDYWAVHGELLKHIKLALDEARIGIPFPQREVWMRDGEKAKPVLARPEQASRPAIASEA